MALVNNMPAGAFERTERQFRRLVEAGAGGGGVALDLYWIPGAPCSGDFRRARARRYLPLDQLYANPPDALIVTGAEPLWPDLTDEVYWDDLTRLLDWAEASVGSAWLSCLAAHAAALHFDGVARRPLARKHTGVYTQPVRWDDPLTAGLASVSVPHSRLNEVPSDAMGNHGYALLADSPEIGWTIATKTRGSCRFVLLQGHPEYSPTSLLREYRRDLRRYTEGRSQSLPPLPVSYLEPEVAATLADFARRVAAGSLGTFPFEAAAAAVLCTWRADAERLFGNWLGEVRARRSETAAR